MNGTFLHRAASHSPLLTDGAPASAYGPRSAAPEQALFQFDLARSLRKHRRLALGFALTGVVLAALYVVRFWSVYKAESLVYIQPTPSAVLEAVPMHWPYNYDPATYDSYIQQQMLSMTRPDVLAGAAKKLDPSVWPRGALNEQAAADRLKGAIEVARVGTSYQVAITAHASNPDAAAAIANAVAESYIENTSHELEAGDAVRLAMLRDERDRVSKELDDDRAEQAALNEQLGVAAIGPAAPEHYDDDIARIHEDLVKARTDHDEAAARLTSMDAGNGASSAALNAEADQLIATDPGLSSLKQALLSRRAALVSQMANLTPSHPLYKQDQAELEKIDASLQSATEDLRSKAAARIEVQLRTDLDRTAGLEARLNGELAQMTRAAAGATPKLQRSSDLANDITRLQTRYNTVDEQLQNQILEDSAPGAAHLAEAAAPPAHPSDIGVIRNALVLLFGFIGLGLAAAVAAHKMDSRVYVAFDVERLLGYAPMAQLPDFDEVSGGVAEEHLLRLATGIEFACRDGELRSCVFTGTGPAVGVTTIAGRVKEMLEAFGKRDLLVTDTAPLSVSAEAEYMARQADCTVLVIESGRTTRAQLRAAAGSLKRLNIVAVGFVLNRVNLANADASFRQSVSEVERHLRVVGQTAARVLQSRRAGSETPLVSPAHEAPALAEKAAMPADLAEAAARPALSAAAERAAAAAESLPHPGFFAATEEQVAPPAPRPGTWPSDAAANARQLSAEALKTEESFESDALTRLSGLRGLFFSTGSEDAGRKNGAERNDSGGGNGNGYGNGYAANQDSHPIDATPPHAGFFDAAPVGPDEILAADPDRTIMVEPVKPDAHPGPEAVVARGGLPRWVTAEPEFLPPRLERANEAKESPARKSRYDEEAFAEIQILRARRGQYRR
jgi:uncharacterized protein involved in exopolysaccharide biosynthesis